MYRRTLVPSVPQCTSRERTLGTSRRETTGRERTGSSSVTRAMSHGPVVHTTIMARENQVKNV